MTTVSFSMPVAMARDVAKVADILGMKANEAVAFEGTRLFLQSILGARRGRPYKHKAPVTKRRRVAR